MASSSSALSFPVGIVSSALLPTSGSIGSGAFSPSHFQCPNSRLLICN